ncbi:MAG: hypothetical protein JSV44_00490 [Candidatus Zixiibacteriota bacterium]|nr:MAG: hypothetical protein JSV44_00490 [candidate division Zixibacteria bacterium]
MMKYVWFFLFTVVLLMSCAEDIYVKPPMTLPGTYDGTYKLVRDAGTPSEKDSFNIIVVWIFTDSNTYSYTVNRDNQDPDAIDVCGVVKGKWNVVEQRLILDSLAEATSDYECDKTLIPKGSFGFVQESDEGIVRMVQDSLISEVQQLRTITLTKQSEE